MINRIRDQFPKLRSFNGPSFHILFSSASVALIFLFADFIFTREFTQRDFGTWRQIVLIVSMGTTLLSLGMPEGYRYFISYEPEKISQHASKIVISTLITSLILYVALNLGGSGVIIRTFKNIDLKYFIPFLPGLFLIVTLSRAYRYLMIRNGETRLLSKYSLISLIMSLILIGFTFFIYDLLDPIYLWAWIAFLIAFIYISLFLFYFVFKVKYSFFNTPIKDNFRFVPYLKIGLPLYIATFIGVLTLNLDKLIVNSLTDIKTFAIYSIGAIEIPIVGMIGSSMAQGIFPQLVTSYKNNEVDNAKDLWIKTTLKSSQVTYPIILVLMIISKPFIILLFTSKYVDAVPIFQTYLLVSFWRNTQYGSLIIASGQTKWTTVYSTFSLILNIGLSVWFYYMFGVIGVAWGAFIAATIVAVLQLRHEKLLSVWLKQIICNKKILIYIISIFVVYFYFIFSFTFNL